MIFVLTLILVAALGAVIWYCSSYADKKYDAYLDLPWKKRQETKPKVEKTFWWKAHRLWDEGNPFYWTILVIFWVFVVIAAIMCICLFCIYGSARGKDAAMQAEYEALVYQMENDIYNDGGDDVVGKKELYDEVKEWNSDLATAKIYVKDFWWGIFWPNYYENLQPIELK